MCEFKVIKNNNQAQIAEDVVISNYTDNNELILKDILGMGVKLDSALILSVNTMNQTLLIHEDPLIKKFLNIIKKKENNTIELEDITEFQTLLDDLKSALI